MNMGYHRVIGFAIGFMLLLAGCSSDRTGVVGEAPPLVRVRLLDNQNRVEIRATRKPTIRTTSDSSPRALEITDQVVPVSLTPQGWRIGAAQVGTGVLTFHPALDGSMAINGQPYHGTFRFVPVGADRFDVVNDVNVEDYLKGVIAREMYPGWAPEAYKAQAIIARTYALYEVKTGPQGRHWDLYPDQRSQVYGGISAESAKAVGAVNATRGIVIAQGSPGQERIFKAYFSACCGGVGQSAADAFGEPWTEALSEQNHGAVCSVSPAFNWSPVSISKQELTRRMRLWGARRNRPEQAMAPLVSLDIQNKNHFGRPVRFVITDARGARYSLSGEELRWAINTDAGEGVTVKSSYFRPIADGESIRLIDGHGYGHGVGLCQWCAQVRAEHGQRAEDIAVSFYNGSRLVRAY